MWNGWRDLLLIIVRSCKRVWRIGTRNWLMLLNWRMNIGCSRILSSRRMLLQLPLLTCLPLNGHEPPRNCAIVKKSSPSIGSPNIYALPQNTLKITVGLGVSLLSVSCWCVLVCWCVWCGTLKTSVCKFKNAPVCGVLAAHTETLGIYTRRRFESTHAHTHTNTHTNTASNRTLILPTIHHESFPLSNTPPKWATSPTILFRRQCLHHKRMHVRLSKHTQTHTPHTYRHTTEAHTHNT